MALDATGRKLGAIFIKSHDAEEPTGGWRLGIGVEAEMRSQGIGRRLLEHAIAFVREQGASYVHLYVDPVNTRAMALYRRVGFVEVGKQYKVLEMRIDLASREDMQRISYEV